jgi:hypothetical protein
MQLARPFIYGPSGNDAKLTLCGTKLKRREWAVFPFRHRSSFAHRRVKSVIPSGLSKLGGED